MKFILKYLVDFGPLAIFFIFYKISNKENSADKILDAVVPLIIATVIAVLVSYILEKKIPIMPTVGAIIVIIFGGLSWYFNNPIFIYYKPTIINLLFASALIVGNVLKQPLLKHLLGENIKLQNKGWDILTIRWIIFFIVLATLNEIVWRNFLDYWVQFKVFGTLILTFIFIIFQTPIITKYQIED
ncbi:septation protein IspZ [Alphaproteobacteria bacterium]|nr:septation protein IspZ [Alphaproteobacteria bacterium]